VRSTIDGCLSPRRQIPSHRNDLNIDPHLTGSITCHADRHRYAYTLSCPLTANGDSLSDAYTLTNLIK
jgi:hypothetical protein